MFDIEVSFDRQLSARKTRPTVVFPEAQDPRVIEAACHLTRFVRPVFLASEAEVRASIQAHLSHVDPNRVEYALSESAFIDIAERTDLLEAFAVSYQVHQKEKGIDLSAAEAQAAVKRPSLFAICAVALGHADMVVGGATQGPKDFYRPMISLLKAQDFACEAGVFVLPDEHPEGIYPGNIAVFADLGEEAAQFLRGLEQAHARTAAHRARKVLALRERYTTGDNGASSAGSASAAPSPEISANMTSPACGPRRRRDRKSVV